MNKKTVNVKLNGEEVKITINYLNNKVYYDNQELNYLDENETSYLTADLNGNWVEFEK